MDEQDLLAAQFETHRTHLRAVAYRILGSASEAEDAVQESWLRLSGSDAAAVANLGGWLTTVVARVALDMLRARRARHEEGADPDLAEPLVTGIEGYDGPEQQALLADAVGLALLVVLDTLTPPERLAFVLHDMFAVPFDEIAPIVERSPAAARQLASRARRRLRGAPPAPSAELAQQRKLVAAFLAASRAGDFDALLSVLDPDVVLRANAGPTATGDHAVARRVLSYAPSFARFGRHAVVNGRAGVVGTRPGDVPAVVLAFRFDADRITAIDVDANPQRLRDLR